MDGEREGYWVHRYQPANVSSSSHYVEEGQHASGKKEGCWVLRWSSGSRVETPCRNGLRHGRQHEYDSAGRLEEAYGFVNDERQD